MTAYKQTELGLIPSDWEVVELGKIANIDPENLTSDTDLNYEFNYISLEQVTLGKLEKTERFKFQNAPSRARRILRKNDILVSTVRPNLMSHYWVKNEVSDLICSTGFSVVRANDDTLVAPYFYHHLFAYIINNQINLLVVGSNYPAINSKDVKGLKFPLPPKPEQTAIATALSDTDALITELEKLLAKKQAIKTATMQQLLTGKTRLPEFAHRADGTPKGSLKTEWGDIPEDWEVMELGRFCNVQGGFSFKSENFLTSGIPVIRIGDIQNGKINLLNTVFWSLENNIPNQFSICFNDAVIAMSGATIGKIGIYQSHYPALINQRVGKFIIKKPEISKDFVNQFISSGIYQNSLLRLLEQGAQPNISSKQLESIFVFLPMNKTEQTAIAQILGDMDSEITALQARIEKLREIKQGMMQNLLTGKIRLPC